MMNSPLLILIGEEDDWCPATMCTGSLPKEAKTEHEVLLKIHLGAHHAFDLEGINVIKQGHRLVYDPAAAADAILQVRNFLAKHMK